MLVPASIYVVTLWEAYRTANRRRAALDVRLVDGNGLGNGRTERNVRISPRRVNGCVAVQQVADWIYVPPERARDIHVERV